MNVDDFFADPTVEEMVTHRLEVVTYHCDGSVRRHDRSEFDPSEGDR